MLRTIFFNLIHRIHRISYISLPQKSIRWTFVKNCGEFLGEFFL